MEMDKGDIIELIYIDKSNHLTQRVIKVLDATDTYVKGYCYSRKEVRCFQRPNILGTKIIKHGA
ncbi:hypothetical protein EV207_10892 [Scopulibacillus darangshiensis]|uniref:WYL domain-containing protein n=1 Tax=Scopulibacillus darangshiensis TaxID=442528 RepID=A0A4R2P4Q5_9BACL|nr:hypothetical protein [Scopulibacillus darangshiensis]TCP29800.1 hypothetical protein EV207_10892 [Scopulibacillus darangshiensis]